MLSNPSLNPHGECYLSPQLQTSGKGSGLYDTLPLKLLHDCGVLPQFLNGFGEEKWEYSNMWLRVPSTSNDDRNNTKKGTSSGLHYDYHDNVYLLLSGYKRIIVIDSKYKSRCGFVDECEYLHEHGQEQEQEESSDDDEEEVVIGGAIHSYDDCDSDDFPDFPDDENDDYDEDDDDGDDGDDGNGDKQKDNTSDHPHLEQQQQQQQRKPNFSTIDMNNPPESYLTTPYTLVDLSPGQLLYMPSGTIHHVTSYVNVNELPDDWKGGREGGEMCMALNWWYNPK
jgi:hypothetical protein